MTRQLILHIGDCKTGSTSIQNMIAGEDVRVEGLRLFTPGAGNHGGLARSLGDRPHLYPQRWERAARRVTEEAADLSILSSELFEFIAPNAVLRALETHFPGQIDALRVVVYVRPHLARVLSQFAENVKLGHSMGNLADFVHKFLADKRLEYNARMARWHAVFGDRLVVRPFVRNKLAEGDVRNDFMSVIAEGRPYSIGTAEPDNNASLGVPDLAMMRYLQGILDTVENIKPDSRVAFGKYLGRLLHTHQSTRDRQKLRLTEELYALLLNACAADAAAMDDIWFGEPCFSIELERGGDSLVPSLQSLRAEDYFDVETLRQARVWMDFSLRQMSVLGEGFTKALNRPG
ncbi:MAG: hypothetical protein AB3N13_11560 [Arenibacterium sp.]